MVLHSSPNELKKDISKRYSSASPSLTEQENVLRMHARQCTCVVYMPDVGYHYLFVRPSWFLANVCAWYRAMDCFIGRARHADDSFLPILSTDHITPLYESDIGSDRESDHDESSGIEDGCELEGELKPAE